MGDFTRQIKTLQPGQKVYIDGPFGHFTIDRHPHAEQFVFIAGGVGITPIMSMLRSMADCGDQRPVTLLYANKDWESIIFREELEPLTEMLNLRLVHVLEKLPTAWNGEQGFITRAILERYLPQVSQPNAAEIFICGPQPMINAVENALTQLGVPFGDFHSERFDLV